MVHDFVMSRNSGFIAPIVEPTDWVNSIAVVEKPISSFRIYLDPNDLIKAIKRACIK